MDALDNRLRLFLRPEPRRILTRLRKALASGDVFFPRQNFMKPTPQNTTAISNGEERSTHEHSTLPVTDYAFQTRMPGAITQASPASEDLTAQARSFRGISRHFFEVDAAREYLLEAVVFGWITLTAAGPLGVLVRQLTTMMIRYQ